MQGRSRETKGSSAAPRPHAVSARELRYGQSSLFACRAWELYLPCSCWQLLYCSSPLKDRVSQLPRGLWGQVLWGPAFCMVALISAL